MEAKYEKLQCEYAKIEVENHLLRREIDDINGTVSVIEDRMQDQYHESLELKMQNAELKERNAYLEKEVLRLRLEKEEATKEARWANKARDTKTTPAPSKPMPSTYKPSGPVEEKRVYRYAQSTASSRAKSTSPPSINKLFAKPSSSVSRHGSTGSNISSGSRLSSGTITDMNTTRAVVNEPLRSKPSSRSPLSERKASAAGMESAIMTKPNVGHKRTLTPQLRETLFRTISRSPAPARVWIDLPVVTDETRTLEKRRISKKGKFALVEDENSGEVAEPVSVKKAGGIKSTAFV